MFLLRLNVYNVMILFSLGALSVSYAQQGSSQSVSSQENIVSNSSIHAERERQILDLDRILSDYLIQLDVVSSPPILSEESNQSLVSGEIITQPLGPPVSSEEFTEKAQTLLESLKNEDSNPPLFQTFEEIIQAEKKYLEEKENHEEFLKFRYFLKDLKPYLLTLKESQGRIEESFLLHNQTLLKKNQMDREAEEFNKRYKALEKEQGSLSINEIESFIDFNRTKGLFIQNGTLKAAIDLTVVYIQSLYGQIDAEKERLKDLGHPIAFLLCDSYFYKFTRESCLPAFEISHFEKLDFLVNSLSPQRWKELEKKVLQKVGYLDDRDEEAIKKSLRNLSLDRELDGIKNIMKTTDFFRWIYFTLKYNLKQGMAPETLFSWTILVESLEKKRKEKEHLRKDQDSFFLRKEQIESEVNIHSNHILKKEEEYFNTILVISTLIDITLSDKNLVENSPVFCLSANLNTTVQWNDCVNKYFDYLETMDVLKIEKETELKEYLRNLLSSSLSLKSQLSKQ